MQGILPIVAFQSWNRLEKLPSMPTVFHKSSLATRFSTVSSTNSFSFDLDPDIYKVFDSIREPISNFVESLPPVLKSFEQSSSLVKWGHVGVMGASVTAMGSIGLFLGIKVKKGEGEEKTWYSFGRSAKEMHPLVMSASFLTIYLGALGGLKSRSLNQKSLLETPHGLTAVLALSLMTIQALTPMAIPKGGKTARKVHTALGMTTFSLLIVHAALGLNLLMNSNDSNHQNSF